MRKIFANQENEIINLYKSGKYSILEIAEKFNVSKTPIFSVLHNNNISTKTSSIIRGRITRKYTLFERYFQFIDDEHKAYILGLIFADGYIHKNKTCFMLELAEKDLYMLEIIKKNIGANNKLFKHICVIGVNKYINYRLTIHSILMYNDLLNLGLIHAKSLTIRFPEINEKLLKHFIRGYFDGDGCIYSNSRVGKKKYTPVSVVEFSILGSQEFIISLKEIIYKTLSITSKIDKSGKNKKITRLRVCAKKDVMKLYHWLYDDSLIHLKRKKDKFEYIKQFIEK